MYQKTPCLYKKPPIDVARMDPDKSNIHQQKHPFYQKKKQLSYPCMLHLWTVGYQKANLVAPIQTKNPRDGLPRGFLLSNTMEQAMRMEALGQKHVVIADCSNVWLKQQQQQLLKQLTACEAKCEHLEVSLEKRDDRLIDSETRRKPSKTLRGQLHLVP